MNWWIRPAEYFRRAIPGLIARPVAVLFAVWSLFIVLFLLKDSLCTVYLTDTTGRTIALVTRERNMETLFIKAGMEITGEELCYRTVYSDVVKSISLQKRLVFAIQADGMEKTTEISGGNVCDVLYAAGITLGEHDYTEPGLNAPAEDGNRIIVHRVQYQDTVATESIPYETEYQYTSLFYKNKRKQVVVVEGHEGTKELIWRERWVDGAFESSQMIASRIAVQPQNMLVKAYAAGVPVSNLTGPDGTTNKPSSYQTVYTGRATGYSSSRSSPRGASGRSLGYGTCAVNPSLIPYGTLLYIESVDGQFVYGYAIAADTGGALLSGNGLVDLYYESSSEALMNAVQQVNVYVVG